MDDLWAPVLRLDRKDRSEMGRIEVGLRNRVIEHLDRSGTLDRAEAMLAEAGVTLSYKSIAMSYRKLRRARRLEEANEGLRSMIESCRETPTLESMEAMLKAVALVAANVVAEADPDTLDPHAALKHLAQLSREATRLGELRLKQTTAERKADAEGAGQDGKPGQLTDEEFSDRARYGIKRIYGFDVPT